jgi:transposase
MSSTSPSLPSQVKNILRKSLQVRNRLLSAQITAHGARTAAGRLESQLVDLVCRPFRKPEFQRFAKHLAHEFPYLFTFLRHPGLDATNWRGEQAIRPAVVTRKVWSGNRTLRGAETQSILASVQRTMQQHQLHPVDSMVPLLRSPHQILLPFWFPPPDS